MQVRATGGGAFKYADLFRERLGVVLCKEDEMACLVDGCSFLLKAIRREAFEFNAGEYAFKSAATGAPLAPRLPSFPQSLPRVCLLQHFTRAAVVLLQLGLHGRYGGGLRGALRTQGR